jgi:hypothetical protein
MVIGMVWLRQVPPPSVVAATPLPTDQQSTTLAQVIAVGTDPNGRV